MLGYRLMPKVCNNWREALFMGYFAPIDTWLTIASKALEQFHMSNMLADCSQILVKVIPK
ncbi:hypothetical protein PENSUB_1658 [Penicillium subrubescens]|uniref:Uncharacterized protein n=1 Tax=Penicillium subrubescens TaxID=1316194 RepID=A0A1Q5UJP4_9EURO|nr:hypothetical protein PENSUB_1658 [Penicillium subrubescens]